MNDTTGPGNAASTSRGASECPLKLWMCTASGGNRSRQVASASAATESWVSVTQRDEPGSRCRSCTGAPSRRAPEHLDDEAGLDGVQQRGVELVGELADERDDVLLGAARRVDRPVQDVQDAGSGRVARRESLDERGERDLERVVRPLGTVDVAEEAEAAAQERRRLLHPGVALLAERRAAPVPHERAVVDDVAEPESGGADAEVDLLAVAPAVRRLVEGAGQVEGLSGHVHAEADAGDDLRRRGDRVGRDERRAVVDARIGSVEVEGVDDRVGAGCRSSRCWSGASPWRCRGRRPARPAARASPP